MYLRSAAESAAAAAVKAKPQRAHYLRLLLVIATFRCGEAEIRLFSEQVASRQEPGSCRHQQQPLII